MRYMQAVAPGYLIQATVFTWVTFQAAGLRSRKRKSTTASRTDAISVHQLVTRLNADLVATFIDPRKYYVRDDFVRSRQRYI
jgi:uncharacterized protein (UPF0548 family)